MSQEKGPDPNCDICNGTGRYFDDDCYVRCPCTPTFPAPRIMPGQRGLTPEEGRERDRIKHKILARLQAILSQHGLEEVELAKREVLMSPPVRVSPKFMTWEKWTCAAIGLVVLLWYLYVAYLGRQL